MQKIRLILLAVLFLTASSFPGRIPEGITLVKVNDGYIINFKLPEFQQKSLSVKGEYFTEVLIDGFGTTSSSGIPALPILSFNLAIPEYIDQPSYQMLPGVTEAFTPEYKIYPFQEPWSKDKPISDRPFNINRQYYNTRGETVPFVTLSESFVLGGVKGIRINLQPFSYNPLENRLEAVKEASVKIIVPSGENLDAKRSSFYNSYLQEMFINYDITSGTKGMNYLIITAPEYEAGLAPFISHKSSFGFTVDVFNTSVTGTTTTAIKTFIQQRYGNPLTKPEFILLVGDVDKIPAWTGTGLGTPKTDLNYVCLEGTDYYADAFIGRFSVTTPQELQNAINKTLYTENHIATIAKKNVFMASTDNHAITEGTHNYVINNYFQPNNYTNLKLYTYTYGATTAQLIAALNDNQMFAIYSGHGSTTSWADGPVLSQSQVRALTNTVFPFVYSFACITGDYAYSECFGETWLRTTTGGTSFYGSSVNSYWDEDDVLEKVLIKSMFVDGITKVTPMFDKAKIYFVNHYGSITPMVLRYLEMYNLMGDPSLETVRHIPPDITPPEAITNLSVLNATSSSLTLNWTAPYDSTFGGVQLYDIRYSSTILNESNFESAPQKILANQSDSAGTPKSFLIDSLSFNTNYFLAVKAKDMWGNTSSISNVVSMSTLAAPEISVSPDSLSLLMEPDSSRIEHILISNICSNPSTLNYTVDLINNTFPGKITVKAVPVVSAVRPEEMSGGTAGKGSMEEKPGMSLFGHGGPDAFGYKWRDSNEPNGPEYQWNSITGTGVQVTNWIATGSVQALDDGYAGPFQLGFNFKYYGDVKTQVYIHTNGLIVFVPVTGSWITNSNIPASAEPNAFIAPFWDDLDGRTQGTVHYKQLPDRFIIQFTNWQKYGASSSSLSFQVVLWKSGKITFYYNTLTGDLNGCTVGIENPGGTTGLPVTYNAAYLTNNKAVEFAAEPEWIYVNNTSGTITSGNTVQFELQVVTNDLEFGAYSMDVRIVSNCPANPVKIIPVRLIVSDQVPVEFITFKAEESRGEVNLEWSTATESNNSGFRVERKSAIESDWIDRGFVKGNGTTSEPQHYSFNDKAGKGLYSYRLVQIDLDGSKSVSKEVDVEITGPDCFELTQNYPNPFNPSTSIKYSLPVNCNVQIVVHNLLGEKIEVITSEIQESGYYSITWNASVYTSGVYICTLDASGVDGKTRYRSTKKMVLIK
jgi:hypothetical protein